VTAHEYPGPGPGGGRRDASGLADRQDVRREEASAFEEYVSEYEAAEMERNKKDS
jgi:hypothetical protein